MVEEELIARITREVLSRIPNGADAPQQKTLLVFAGYAYEQARVAEHLAKQYGSADCALFGDAAVSNPALTLLETGTQAQRRRLVERLSGYETVVAVTPSLEYLSAATEGDDTRLDVALLLRPLLWRKKTVLLLDFVPPKNKRGFARLTDSLETLGEMGAIIETLPQQHNAAKGGEAKKIVTAEDVRDAAVGSGYIRIAPGAIVTHLAADMAKELDVRIEG